MVIDPPPRHAPYYCEENIWHLCAHPALAGRRIDVVFISNQARSVALWAQRAGAPDDGVVVWDYHVIGTSLAEDGAWQVWDLDCARGWPLPAAEYLTATFPPSIEVPVTFAPRFRVVEAAVVRRTFASDRAHMRTRDGGWLAPPPAWPVIGDGAASNLDRFIDTEADDFVGICLTLPELRARLTLTRD